MCSRQVRSLFRSSSGISSRSVSFASPTSGHSIGVADRQHPAVDVDLDAARLAGLRQPLRVREARPDHQQRVALVHERPARLRPEQADRARHEREVVGERRPCRAAPSRHPPQATPPISITSSAAPSAPWPTSIATFLPAFRISAARSSSAALRHDARPRIAGAETRSSHARAAASPRPAPLRGRSASTSAGHRALVQRDADARGRRGGGSAPARPPICTYSCGDVLEERHEVDLLLVAPAEAPTRDCWPTIASTGWWSSFAS